MAAAGPAELDGWLLDVYAAPEGEDGLTVWLLGADGRRYRLRQPFGVTFYAAGPAHRLRELWRYLQEQPLAVDLERSERRDLFSPGLLTVLAARVARPAAQPRLLQQVTAAFPDLTYFDADLPLALRYAAASGAFPLARCRARTDGRGGLLALEAHETAWDLDPAPPPLRTLELAPDCDPAHAPPRHLLARCGRASYRLALHPPRPLLVNLRAILLRHDPDLLLTSWGDSWLLPHLLELADELGLALPLNRDPGCAPAYRREHSYFSYGQIIYRSRQVHLFGRWHIDTRNAMLFGDYGLEGIFEQARVTGLPVQTVARNSPGSGITAVQILTALRQGILVPYQKQQAEYFKTARDLLHADQGGMIYQPLLGLHRRVAAIDFVSMYPSIIVHFNISPETVAAPKAAPGAAGAEAGAEAALVPELNLRIARSRLGMVPAALAPLLAKRIALKERLAGLDRRDCRYAAYQARAAALKWLLVVCFGYLGYKNARFGRIESHEAVTAYGRECLLRAKETAEELGFTVLHMYVDSLFVQHPDAAQAEDLQPLLERIAERTGLPIALDGIYRWVAFLPSRQDGRVAVANRYFGVFEDGTLKVRGLAARRRDTPRFVAEAQMQLLELLARAPDADHLKDCLPEVRALLHRRLAALRGGQAPLEALLVGQKLSRELEAYRSPSPAARAAAQLAAAGKPQRPGQRVRFIYTRGEPGVYAWDLPTPPQPASVDVARYAQLLLDAAAAVLEPLGLWEEDGQERLWLVEAGGEAVATARRCEERVLRRSNLSHSYLMTPARAEIASAGKVRRPRNDRWRS